jgi:proteasome lid subunit RPN8/RPN11
MTEDNAEPIRPTILIRVEAYYQMLKHVLQYGNTYLETSEAVLGMCYGTITENKIVLKHVIPIKHGKDCDILFTSQDKTIINNANRSVRTKKLKPIGWYHSHPNGSTYMDKIDIKNQLFFQKEQTPYMFCIVFDHTYLDDNLGDAPFGFKLFQLDHYKLGIHSDYHECNYDIEIDPNVNPYTEIDSIIAKIQSNQPYITELSDRYKKSPSKKKKTEKIQGVKSLSKKNLLTSTSLISFFAMTSNSTMVGPLIFIETLNEMKEAIKHGINRFKEDMEKRIQEIFTEIELCMEQPEIFNAPSQSEDQEVMVLEEDDEDYETEEDDEFTEEDLGWENNYFDVIKNFSTCEQLLNESERKIKKISYNLKTSTEVKSAEDLKIDAELNRDMAKSFKLALKGFTKKVKKLQKMAKSFES